jgi:hypothetical protein
MIAATPEELAGQMRSAAFWREINPDLHVSDDLCPARAGDASAPPEGDRRGRMRTEGFFATGPFLPGDRMASMAAGTQRVMERGIHELFALVYDEFWMTLRDVSALVDEMLGPDHRIVPMPYVNVVPAGEGNAGFGIHRDRFDDPITPDGMPNTVTAWISLTDANPERACLYVVPTSRDPNFPDSLRQLAIDNVQDIRAVPVAAGSVVCFNQAIMHWSGRNTAGSGGARVSFAFEFERNGLPDAREPTVSLAEILDLRKRLGFIGTMAGMLSRNNVMFPDALLEAARILAADVYCDQFADFWATDHEHSSGCSNGSLRS